MNLFAFGTPFVDPSAKWHHLLPQTLFKRYGLDRIVNIHLKEFARMMPKGLHDKLHAAGWNDTWEKWILERGNKPISPKDIRAKLRYMMTEDKRFKDIFARASVKIPKAANYAEYLKNTRLYVDRSTRLADAKASLQRAQKLPVKAKGRAAAIANAKKEVAAARKELANVEKWYQLRRINRQMKYRLASRAANQLPKATSNLTRILGRLARSKALKIGGRVLAVVGAILLPVELADGANRVEHLNRLRDEIIRLNKALIDELRFTEYQLDPDDVNDLTTYMLSLRRLVNENENLADNVKLKKALLEILDAIEFNLQVADGSRARSWYIIGEAPPPAAQRRKPAPMPED